MEPLARGDAVDDGARMMGGHCVFGSKIKAGPPAARRGRAPSLAVLRDLFARAEGDITAEFQVSPQASRRRPSTKGCTYGTRSYRDRRCASA